MRMKSLILSLVLLTPCMAVLGSHHAFAPYFDSKRPVSINGTIVKVDWVNPVVFVHLRVTDSVTGQATTWAFEAPAVGTMKNFGLSQEMFKDGGVVTVVGWMGRPGANISETVADPELAARVRSETAACAAQFEFADGRKFPVVDKVPLVPVR